MPHLLHTPLTMGRTLRTRNQASDAVASKDEQLALHKCLLLLEAFRAIRRLMPLQHAYAFVQVALEQGLGVSEYAKRVGVTQSVMTRILFSLASSSQGRGPGYGLVQQAIDLENPRRTQSFLTAKGKVLMREIARLVHSNQTKPQRRDLTPAPEPERDIARDQWLSRLVAAGDKLDTKNVKLAVQLIEALVRHSRS
jgi:DNA-binding MarR family transcriptional regulator